MIRALLLVTLIGTLALVLYVPAAFPPDRLIGHLRAEYQTAGDLWGEEASIRMLTRALRLEEAAGRGVSHGRPAHEAQASGPVNEALAREMASATHRLFDSIYFRSLEALLLLAAFRLATLLEWLPVLLVFVMANLLDGAVVRRLRAKEFRQHDPEMFAIHASLAVAVACTAMVLLVAPVTLHPGLLPSLPILLAIPVGRALASFHGGG